MEGSTSKRIHPLVAGAAIAVMLASLTGVAAMTGILPTSHGSAADNAPVPAVAAIDPATVAPVTAPAAAAPAAANPAPQAAAKQAETARASRPAPAAKAPAACYTCGRVESVQVIQQEAPASGVGMVAGALIGGATARTKRYRVD